MVSLDGDAPLDAARRRRRCPRRSSASRVCGAGAAGEGGSDRRRRGAREPRRRRGCTSAVVLDEGPAGLQVRVLGGLADRDDPGDAGVGALEDLDPLGLGALLRTSSVSSVRSSSYRSGVAPGPGAVSLRPSSVDAARRRTAAPARRPTCACRRRSRRRRSRARRRRAGWPPRSSW